MVNSISRESFDGMPVKSQLGVLFDLAKESHKCACTMEGKLITLERKFDKKKRFDTSVSAATGIIGGALAALGIKFGG